MSNFGVGTRDIGRNGGQTDGSGEKRIVDGDHWDHSIIEVRNKFLLFSPSILRLLVLWLGVGVNFKFTPAPEIVGRR